MKTKFKWLIALMIVITTTLVVKSYFTDANAAVTVDDFYFSDPNGNKIYDSSNNALEMTTAEKEVYVTTKDGMNTTDDVDWSSSNDNIVKVTKTGSNVAKLTRVGPGYVRITAKITRGSVYYSISMMVKVDVDIKMSGNDINDKNYTPLVPIANDKEKALVLDYCIDPNYPYKSEQDPSDPHDYNNSEKIILRYTYDNEAVMNDMLSWKSSDETVVSVSNTGVVTAKGAGEAYITVSTNTTDGVNQSIVREVRVIVNPLVNVDVTGENGEKWVSHVTKDKDKEGVTYSVITASSDFYIQTNAMKATNLDWVVTHNGNVLSPNSDVLNYRVSNTSGIFEISNAKVGVYEVQAFAKGKNKQNINIRHVNLKVIVPFSAPDILTMNVTDTYDLVKNLNMSSGFINIDPDDKNIVDDENGILIAKNKGTTTVTLEYLEYKDGMLQPTKHNIIVNVIDALALNLSDATIYVNGSVKLDASVTDTTAQLTWTSSNPSIAKVEDGKVTGVAPGSCTITVSTTINGVYKSASCKILVVPTVTNIVIDPSEATISIGEYKTLTAQVTPATINNVELKWISSDKSVVEIVENGKKFVTIRGISGGSAVITAINEDNIVVGFCKVTVKQPVTSITLSESNVTVSLSASSFQLRATVYPKTATNQALKYTSTNTNVVRVDDEGKVTLVSAGTATVIVTSVDSPSVSAMCNITVTTPVTGIALDETSASMVVGETKRLTYTIIPTTATNKDVTWTSSDMSVAAVSATGIVTANRSGSAIITVTTADGKHSKSCTIIVGQYASSIKLDVSNLTLNVNETYTFKVTTTPASSTDTFTWETSNANVATVSTTGKVTAKAEGTALIIVKSSRGVTAYCNVKVEQQATGIVLNFETKTVVVSNSFTLKATVLPANASNQKVTYKSSNTKVATVSSKGKVKGIKGGTAIITVTSEDGNFKETCIVTVKELVTKIELKSSYKVPYQKTYTIVPTVKSNSATNTKLQWSSSNTKIATVDKNGKITAKAYGKATITVKATDGSGSKATTTVHVVRPVTRITLDKTVLSIVEGRSKKLTATVRPSNATYQSVTWTSSDEKVAVVDAKGNVTALSPGTATIRATAKDGTKKYAQCYVTVEKKVPATAITVANQSIVMVSGESQNVHTVMSPANSTDGYTWSSDNTAVASVHKSTGRILAKSVGTATITVMTDSGRKARITVNVVGLSKTSLTLEQYSTATLTVNGDISRVIWDVEDSRIATISSSGKITSRAIGSTKIVALVNGRKLYCKLNVTKIR